MAAFSKWEAIGFCALFCLSALIAWCAEVYLFLRQDVTHFLWISLFVVMYLFVKLFIYIKGYDYLNGTEHSLSRKINKKAIIFGLISTLLIHYLDTTGLLQYTRILPFFWACSYGLVLRDFSQHLKSFGNLFFYSGVLFAAIGINFPILFENAAHFLLILFGGFHFIAIGFLLAGSKNQIACD